MNNILARTLWGEARGESCIGMRAVACVVLNRLQVAQENEGYWWGDTIEEICTKPWQFSCWNRNDPNRKKLLSITDKDPLFRCALQIEKEAQSAILRDITFGATHYHHVDLIPHWTKGEAVLVRIGSHLFYRIL